MSFKNILSFANKNSQVRHKFDVIIAGSGLGGLVSAALLSKEGMRVLVLEQHWQFGGNLQTFKRDGYHFGTGMNYIGAMAEDQFLHRYFNYLGIIDDLNLRQLDVKAFEQISFANDGKRYNYAQGYDNFIENLAIEFPEKRKVIESYLKKIWEITDGFPLLHLEKFKSIVKDENYRIGGAWDYIKSLHPDKRFRNVLGAANILYGGDKVKTPFYVHALVNRQFIESAWRFVDGSQQLSDALVNKIRTQGGELHNNSEVCKINFQDNESVSVETLNGEKFFAKKIISNIHPAVTLKLIDDTRLKKVYRKRINNLSDTNGMFSVYFILKKNSFQYIPRNIYHFAAQDVWHNDANPWPQHFYFYTPASSQNPEWVSHATALSPMSFGDVKKWENTFVENRGQEYLDFKREKAEQLIDLVEKRIPGFRSKILKYYTSTPLSYRDYTGTRNGSSYGVLKDHENPYSTIVLPRTAIPNLFFTGQNMNMHGALGVTAGAILTVGELIGLEYLTTKIYDTIR